ncbi:hypothetical protein EVAR_2858_1 [Eumeta japonica]|uniref:Mariner Mos1 transposase n=1 Tax=Eumeta variegata TaxID=151549 RepID=A0A4C1T0Q9_EUMVA|nr:hypothetical protein EVAR_2858_1 [Eumeta japonica]
MVHVVWYNVMFTRFKGKTSNFVWDVVIGDKTWIYIYDPKTKQQSTLWIYRVEQNPTTRMAHEQRAFKQVIDSFFYKTGHVANVALDNYCTTNSDWYTTISLPEVINELRKNNRELRTISHNDNASSHSAKQTKKL